MKRLLILIILSIAANVALAQTTYDLRRFGEDYQIITPERGYVGRVTPLPHNNGYRVEILPDYSTNKWTKPQSVTVPSQPVRIAPSPINGRSFRVVK